MNPFGDHVPTPLMDFIRHFASIKELPVTLGLFGQGPWHPGNPDPKTSLIQAERLKNCTLFGGSGQGPLLGQNPRNGKGRSLPPL